MTKNIQKKLANLANLAPKTLATILLAINLSSCEPVDRQMAYMTPSERDDYEAHGILPKDIEKSKTDEAKTIKFGLAMLGAIAAGIALSATLSSKSNNKNKQH